MSLDLYVPILALGLLAAGFAIFSIAASWLSGPRRYNRARLDSYECGIEPTPQPIGGGRFPVKYFITAMLFIVFDIEIIFLYPYAVSHRELGGFGLWAILIFSLIFFMSFVYEIARGGLDWGPARRDRPVGPVRSPGRTAATTIRRVGLEGREHAA